MGEVTLTMPEAEAIIKGEFDYIEKELKDENKFAEDFMIEAIKQARLHLDFEFETRFKWGGCPPPPNYNEYRNSRSFKDHAFRIYSLLKEYMVKGDVAEEKKKQLIQIHQMKGVKTVEFHHVLNGILISFVIQGRYKTGRNHKDMILAAEFAKQEKAWRMCYDKVKYGLTF